MSTDWRAELVDRIRSLVLEAEPEATSLDAGTRRAIDVSEDEDLDGPAFVELVREAVAANRA